MTMLIPAAWNQLRERSIENSSFARIGKQVGLHYAYSDNGEADMDFVGIVRLLRGFEAKGKKIDPTGWSRTG